MDKQLKPCPFCGGEAKLIESNQCLAKAYTVVCKDKLCRGRSYKCVRAKHTAIEMWNRRVNNG